MPDIAAISKALNELNAELFVVVEQDMYPVKFDRPKPIAERTRQVLHRCGIGR
jgi:inosose dehydratase